MKRLSFCAICGKEKEEWIHNSPCLMSVQGKTIENHEFVPCVSLNELKERDERLARELEVARDNLGDWNSNSDELIFKVVGELRKK